MGTTIHNMTEVRQADGTWEAVIDDPDKGPRSVPDIYRDYDLFAVIADVRNDGYRVPISGPRGVPKDVSCDWAKAVVTQVPGHWHDHSWVTLAELEAYDWGEDGPPDILEELRTRGGPDDVRMVFAFDT